MKLLFISSRDVTKKSHGGFLCTNRNYESFCRLLGKENVLVINPAARLKENIRNRLKKWGNYFLGYSAGFSSKIVRELVDQAKHVDFVVIDYPGYGILAKHLKKAEYYGKIISFFQNAEIRISKEQAKLKPLQSWRILLMYYNEKATIQYSDVVVALNERDSLDLQKIYGTRHFELIPISLIDKAPAPTVEDLEVYTQTRPICLFVGNNWYPNVHGLRWFVDHVLDDVDIRLQIVGTGMDTLKNQFIHPKIEFLGFVKDLDNVMRNADVLLSPIFLGSGMKVKTCESLMYGKNIIGTSEAFEGYDLDFERAGSLCNTKEEFVISLKNLAQNPRKRYNSYCRKTFLERYSFEATLKKFERLQ